MTHALRRMSRACPRELSNSQSHNSQILHCSHLRLTSASQQTLSPSACTRDWNSQEQVRTPCLLQPVRETLGHLWCGWRPHGAMNKSAHSFTVNLYERFQAFMVWMKSTWPLKIWTWALQMALEDLETSAVYSDSIAYLCQAFTIDAWTVFTVKTGLALKAWTCTTVEQARRWIPKLYSCSHLRDNPETSIS